MNLCRASDKCQREKRKTINGDDLLWAMATLGFEDYIDPLKIYLTRYREVIALCFMNLWISWVFIVLMKMVLFISNSKLCDVVMWFCFVMISL